MPESDENGQITPSNVQPPAQLDALFQRFPELATVTARPLEEQVVVYRRVLASLQEDLDAVQR
ncbi:hypothetical protein KIM372_07230 [Bombiscardovia nodaiensis]|uniref:Uncharacterized protein n=1 Tax=Bombiscardovia nodaiensis TaxID=2932181 RepID=A0ABN6SCE3_9BIFI|nr:hypothetical protein KIM372_07230 [Bombiscardovia nodaiensis]